MRKILSFFAFVAIVISFAACGGNNPEIAGFTIEQKTISATDASFTITPLDEEADYFWFVYPKCCVEWEIRDGYCSSEEGYIDNWLQSWADPNIFWNGGKERHGKKGTATLTEEDVCSLYSFLAPNYEHRIAVCKIDADKKRAGSIVFYSFKTLIPEGYVDLGLPSGNLWTTQYVMESSQPVRYTFQGAKDKWYYNTYYYECFPTWDTWQELRDYCDWKWENTGGRKGYRVSSKTNDNSIFLWAAGWKDTNGNLDEVGTKGGYWTIDEGNSSAYHYAMVFTNGSFSLQSYSNNCEFSLCFYCPCGEAYYAD